MTHAEIRILKSVLRNGESWERYDNTFGQRIRNAAEKLRSLGLVKIVEIGLPVRGVRQYVVIGPKAEWDYKHNQLRGGA